MAMDDRTCSQFPTREACHASKDLHFTFSGLADGTGIKGKGRAFQRRRDDAWNVGWKQQWRLPCSEGMKAKSIWVTSCEVGLLSSTCHAWTFLASSCKCQSDRLSPYGEQRNQSFLCIKPTRNWHFDESLEGLATWAPWKLSRQVCWFTLCHRPNYLLQSIWHCSQLRRVYTLEAFAQLPNADPWKNNAGLKQILAIACIKACANLPIHGCSLSGSIFSHLSVRTTAFWRPQLSWRDFAYAAISIHDSAQPTSTPMAL